MTLLDNYLYEIQEVKNNSVTRVTRGAKIARATGALATNVAKQKNDPMVKRMEFYRRQYQKLKQRVMQRYAARVRSQARK